MTPAPRRTKRILAALAIGGVLALGAAELGLRLVFLEDGMFRGRRPLPPYESITNPRQREWAENWRARLARGETSTDDIGGFSKTLGWDMHPSAISADGRYRTNSLAARGPREYAPEPPAGVTRLLCFGDSFTFCDEVADEATWPSGVERILPTVEAVNFGVGGHGTDQALLRYRAVRDRVRGHVVTIGIMLENIGRNVNRYRPLYYPATGVAYAKPRFILSAGRLELLPLPFDSFDEYLGQVLDGSVLERLRQHERWHSPEPWTGRALATVRLASAYFAARDRAHRTLWEDPSGEPFRVSLELLSTFHREAMDAGALAAPVLVFPAETDLDALLTEERTYWTPLLRALDEREIPYLDLAQPLAERCSAAGIPARSRYVGGHLDPAANEVVATTLAAWLRERIPALR